MKTKLYFSIILLGLFFSACENLVAQAPDWQWASSGGGTDWDLPCVIATDSFGNSFVTGSFQSNPITFDTITLSNTGNLDPFIVKYDPSGHALWAKSGSGTNLDQSFSVAVDAGGNSYISGNFFSDTLTFDSISLINSGADIFVAKFDPSGNVVWLKSILAATGSNHGMCITVDASRNLFVAGSFTNPILTAGSITIGNASIGGGADIFVVKYDSLGNVVWAKNAGYNDDEFPSGMAVDVSGNVYITGYFTSSIFPFGSSTLLNTGSNDIFILKYGSAGNALWAKCAGATNNDYGNGIAVDTSGNSYITGSYMSPTLTFGSTTLTNVGSTVTLDDMFITKYKSSENLMWAQNIGDTYNEVATAISVDKNANVYVTGFFDSPTVTFGSTTLTNATSTTADIFVTKYDSSGNALWAKSAGGTGWEEGLSITVGLNGSVYLMGQFSDSLITFGNTTLINAGYQDMFIAKLDSGNPNINCSASFTLYPDTIPHNWFALNQATGTAPINYLWNWGDGTTASGPTPSHTYNVPGYYNICLTINDSTGCISTYCDSSTYIYKGTNNSVITINVVTSLPNGIEDINGYSSINISPNPVHDVLNVSLNKPLPGNTLITINDMQGRIVKEEKISNANGLVIPINVSGLSQGVYLLKMEGVVWKFVKL